MHLGDGALTPECAVVALGVAASGAGVSLLAARVSSLQPVRARTAALLGAGVFAAQMFNVTILPHSSAHLIGGVLLAWVLGPAVGFLTMCGILALQAIALGDGGLMALGANAINMGLVPAIAVAALGPRSNQLLTVRSASQLASIAFLSTVAGAVLLVGEVSFGRSATELTGFGTFASQMIWMHAAAGVLEAAATIAIVTVLAHLRQPREQDWRFSPACSVGLVAASVAVVVLSTPALGVASQRPDCYESAVAASGVAWEACTPNEFSLGQPLHQAR